MSAKEPVVVYEDSVAYFYHNVSSVSNQTFLFKDIAAAAAAAR